MDAGEDDGTVAGVVARCGGVLLVGTVLLLVDEDERKRMIGEEEGGTGADEKMGAAFA